MTTAEKLTAIAENQVQVYEAGQAREYDRFWDAYQQKGNRRNYLQAFAGQGWTKESFKPKYDIKPIGSAQQMFTNSLFAGDLVQHLAGLGVTLDVSKATSLVSLFYSAQGITHIGCVDATGSPYTNSAFEACFELTTIDQFIVNERNTFSSTFGRCNKLTNLTIDGVIANDMDLSACPLTRGSILSVLEALSAAASGKTVTFQQAAVAAAFTTAEWEDLVASKPNWNIRQQ